MMALRASGSPSCDCLYDTSPHSTGSFTQADSPRSEQQHRECGISHSHKLAAIFRSSSPPFEESGMSASAVRPKRPASSSSTGSSRSDIEEQ